MSYIYFLLSAKQRCSTWNIFLVNMFVQLRLEYYAETARDKRVHIPKLTLFFSHPKGKMTFYLNTAVATNEYE